jgi:hypothetical protein
MRVHWTNKLKKIPWIACVSRSASRSRSWTFQGTSHVNYLVIKTYKLAEQTGSYTPNPTREEYGSNRQPLPPRRYPWYSFVLQAESTPGPYYGRKDYVKQKFLLPHRELNLRPSSLWHSASTDCAAAYPALLCNKGKADPVPSEAPHYRDVEGSMPICMPTRDEWSALSPLPTG